MALSVKRSSLGSACNDHLAWQIIFQEGIWEWHLGASASFTDKSSGVLPDQGNYGVQGVEDRTCNSISPCFGYAGVALKSFRVWEDLNTPHSSILKLEQLCVVVRRVEYISLLHWLFWKGGSATGRMS